MKLLSYTPETGGWRWLVNVGRKIKAGQIAGCLNRQGYWVVGIDGKLYQSHRLAWLYMTGKWPAVEIDHRDRNRANNKWSNLREATRQQNSYNGTLSCRNTSGHKGVSFEKNTGRWRARLWLHNLGSFESKEEARLAYLEAARAKFGDFASSGVP